MTSKAGAKLHGERGGFLTHTAADPHPKEAPPIVPGLSRIAASCEAKAFGVKTGTRISDSRALCADRRSSQIVKIMSD
jgi:hypothetical protein